MPRFNSDTMEQHQIGGSSFHFTATKINELGATEYTIVAVVFDRSGTMGGYQKNVDKVLQTVVEGCRKDPRADNLMLLVSSFDHHVEEVHGFKPLPDCNAGDYDGVCQPRGATALYDATFSAIKALAQYAKELRDNDFAVNAALFVITDGMDNDSSVTRQMVRDAMTDARRQETMESIMPVLIGVGFGASEDEGDLSDYLKVFMDEAGFQQYIFADVATPDGVAKLGGFISKSMSSQSRALGSGGPSQSVSF